MAVKEYGTKPLILPNLCAHGQLHHYAGYYPTASRCCIGALAADRSCATGIWDASELLCVAAQTVYGCAALTLLVPVFFHWSAPREDEEDSKAWASSGLSWQAKIQLLAFCAFEVLSLVHAMDGVFYFA